MMYFAYNNNPYPRQHFSGQSLANELLLREAGALT
jgi:hypothetical protein